MCILILHIHILFKCNKGRKRYKIVKEKRGYLNVAYTYPLIVPHLFEQYTHPSYKSYLFQTLPTPRPISILQLLNKLQPTFITSSSYSRFNCEVICFIVEFVHFKILCLFLISIDFVQTPNSDI